MKRTHLKLFIDHAQARKAFANSIEPGLIKGNTHELSTEFGDDRIIYKSAQSISARFFRGLILESIEGISYIADPVVRAELMTRLRPQTKTNKHKVES